MNERGIAVAKLSEMNDGEMKEVSVNGTKVLLARVGDNCYAVGAHCTHYDAPLVKGVLSGERLVCPWHHACFNITTGDLEEPPAFDALPRFDVAIEEDDVFVRLPEVVPDRRTPAMAKRDVLDKRTFVILGGGAAGYMAAQTLREDGVTGRVVMITRESHLPYDRPNLSKDYLSGHADPEWMPLRPDDFFDEYAIEVLREKEATSINAAGKIITLNDGEDLQYDSLLIATGGMPRKLPFQSDDTFKNVFLLRSFSDSDAIIAAAEKEKRAIVIGASFIGMETAASLKTRGCEVTVIAPDEVPFQKTLGTEIGKLFKDIHERKGVRFRLGATVTSFEGSENVEAILLDDGERLEADLVVVGVGVKPATDFLQGVELHKDGGVITNKYLEIGDSLYAAGDIVHFPDSRTGEMTRIEHWRTALQQGRTAAHNMAGNRTPFIAVPFFWTMQFGKSLRYVGNVKNWDKIVFQGDVDKQDFLAFYVKDNRILAVAGMNRDRDMAIWEERIRNNGIPSSDQLSDGPAEFQNNSIDSSSFSALRLL
ncbi:MAG TPA: FAD-dependent oxidoreductase [Pyrinomonadaceae bacterium]|nr:FAD-dependent oxidoreductase [Pyrinomonadaceae bacterium]